MEGIWAEKVSLFEKKRARLCCAYGLFLPGKADCWGLAAADAAAGVRWVDADGLLGYQERTRTEAEETALYEDSTLTASDALGVLYPAGPEHTSDNSVSGSGEVSQLQQQEQALRAAVATAGVAVAALHEAHTQAAEQAFIRAAAMVRAHRKWTLQRSIMVFVSTVLFITLVAVSPLPLVVALLMGVCGLLSSLLAGLTVLTHLSLARANEQRLKELREAFDSGRLDALKPLLARHLINALALPADILLDHQTLPVKSSSSNSSNSSNSSS
ncbi:hypothetical protein Esti_001942 [Eimeria stiedai]